MKRIIVLILFTFLASCGSKSDNANVNKNTLLSVKLNDQICSNCVIINYSNNIVSIVMNQNAIDNDCPGENQVVIDNGNFVLPMAGARVDYTLDSSNSFSSCSIFNANTMYVLENNGLYDLFIGNYKITLKGAQ